MLRALYSSAAGMQSQQLNLDVIANNLANVNTTGFAAQPGIVRPRWPDHLRFWEMLEAAARCESATALQWAHCVGVCLLGVDAAGATPGPTRRRPRR